MRIDAHQHFWHYHPVRDAWITDAMKNIQRDFLPGDLGALLNENSIEGCVAVQADQSENETNFLLGLAERNPFIKGVVGWVDLCDPEIEKRLAYFSKFKLIKGFRHVVQGEAEDFLLQEDFCRGVSSLHPYGFTYDILIYPKHLPATVEFVERFPKQKFVLDHLAKPSIRDREMSEWEKNIRLLAQFKNVSCKLSGMVTEANWTGWRYEDLFPYIDIIVANFGTERIMYGSDWPVCLVAAEYKQQLDVYRRYFKDYSQPDQQKVFGGNAKVFYNL
jgi:L-fuconolactonase